MPLPAALSFLLSLGLVAVPLGWIVSVVSLVALAPGPLLSSLPPARRADVAAWLGLAPLASVAAITAAVSLPSLLYIVGLGQDHCFEHLHHLHLCWLHGYALPPLAALTGAGLWARTMLCWVQIALRLIQVDRIAARLAGIGAADGGVVWVPAGYPLCHTVGLFRPVILLSSALKERLTPEELEAAILHEQAHIDRRDPAWSAALAASAAFALPGLRQTWCSVWRQAAEEAADAVAASCVGRDAVASSLIRVARLQGSALSMPKVHLSWMGFSSVGLEARVRNLLDRDLIAHPSRAIAGTLVWAMALAAVVALAHDPLHHLVEEQVERLVIGIFRA
jgi:Zn-dependent protease with chaperone function